MDKRIPFKLLREAFMNFLDDDVMTMSASLSFYTLLSFAPLIVLGVWLTSSLGHGTQEIMLSQLADLAGKDARVTAQAVIDSANRSPSLGSVAGIAGIVISVIGATTVFAQLQTSLNRIWEIEARPGNAIWDWLRRRILSIGVIGAIIFVLIVSLLLSSALGLFLNRNGPAWDVLNQLISIGVFAGLFGLLFRYLADVQLAWRRAVWGGLVASVLFGAGKWVIGFYLAQGHVGGAYGAAGSLVVLLVWVYYSSAIFFFSAEIVQAWFKLHGQRIEPAAHAIHREFR